jgi:hypothetical protein
VRRKRCANMPSFRIFYFRQAVLDHAEEVEAGDLVGAVRRASGKAPDLKAEIWSEKGKVGIIGTSRDPAHYNIDFAPRAKPRLPQ